MMRRALRPVVRALRGAARSARQMLCAGLVVLAPASVAAQDDAPALVAARYVEPTDRYPHGVLGDDIEYGALELTFEDASRLRIRLPDARVFEDTAPRLADVTGDGQPEVVVVESHQDTGARLAIYTRAGLLAATPYIGQRFRWLAPVAIGDLDGDGSVELAYIDRPHLAKTLRVWRYSDGELTQIAHSGGLTNHRIGERDIAGGLRDCVDGLEMIVASADWTRVIAVRLENGKLTQRDIGPHANRASFAAALSCQ